jgi:hypothetical protein
MWTAKKVFEFDFQQWNCFSDKLGKEPLNAIEKLFVVSQRIHEEMKNLNPIVLFELKKYYESLFNKHQERKQEFINRKMRVNLEQGIKEGLYRSDINIELVMTLYVNYLMEMHNQGLSKTANITIDKIFEIMFESHIRAISTPEGVKYFENRKKEISNYLITNNNL